MCEHYKTENGYIRPFLRLTEFEKDEPKVACSVCGKWVPFFEFHQAYPGLDYRPYAGSPVLNFREKEAVAA